MRRRIGTARTRSVGLVSVVLVAIAAVAYLVAGGLVFQRDTGPAVIDVAMDMTGYDTPEIRVSVGQPVTIRLTSLDAPLYLDDGGRHQLAVEELGVDIIAPAQGSASATFTPTEVGTYEFYCDVCCGGRSNPAMVGTLIVEGA